MAESIKEFDQRIQAELSAINPAAAGLFAEANEARARGDLEGAIALYAKVLELAPDFVHALRRQCTCERELGQREQALTHCSEALEKEGSAENEAALASVLLMATNDSTPSVAERKEALHLAQSAAQRKPEEASFQFLLCEAAWTSEDAAGLAECTERLKVLAPDEPQTQVFLVIRYSVEGSFGDAFTALERARALGLPEDVYQEILGTLEEVEPFPSRIWRYASGYGLWIGLVWLLGLLLLFTAGWYLNRAALKAAAQAPTESSGRAVGLGGTLRRLYQAVLWLCCTYYYLSLPLVLLLVLGTGLGIFYAFWALGRIPIKLVLVVAVLMLGTLWAVLKSVFARSRDEAPGRLLDLTKHPRLRALLNEVAARIETRPVDHVYLTPGTDVAVLERGRLSKQLRGSQERCLVLGVGVLEGFSLRPFKAVLAHEYGHFSNRDTAGGGFALAVRRSIYLTALGLARNGGAAWYNPAWLFLRGFEQIFLRISQGASRLQEVLADRWAAFCYGSQAFEAGLRHVIEREVRFQLMTRATVQEILGEEEPKPLSNLYTYLPQTPPAIEEIDEKAKEALDATPNPFDSHPAPKERFAWVHALGTAGDPPSPQDEDEVWSLFSDREEIERWMTGQVRENILASSGVTIPAEPPPSETEPLVD